MQFLLCQSIPDMIGVNSLGINSDTLLILDLEWDVKKVHDPLGYSSIFLVIDHLVDLF